MIKSTGYIALMILESNQRINKATDLQIEVKDARRYATVSSIVMFCSD